MLQNNLLRRKISLETASDRKKAVDKIEREALQLKRLFKKVAGDMADFDSPFNVLPKLVSFRILLSTYVLNTTLAAKLLN